MNKRIFFQSLCLLCLCTSLYAQGSLLLNPGFEEGAGTEPDSWKLDSWLKDSSVTEYEWVTGTAHSGKRCVLIKNHELNDARIVQQATIQKGKLYKFSCWIKTENIGNEGAGAMLSIISMQETSTRIHGTNDWAELEIYIQGASDDLIIKLSAGIGGYSAISRGFAWFDDANLAEVAAAPESAKVIVLKEKDGGLSQAEKNKYKLKIETRSAYWLITILIVVAAAVVLIIIVKRIKGEEQTANSSPESSSRTEKGADKSMDAKDSDENSVENKNTINDNGNSD